MPNEQFIRDDFILLKNGNEQPLVALNENMNIMHRNTHFLKVLLGVCDRQREEAANGFK